MSKIAIQLMDGRWIEGEFADKDAAGYTVKDAHLSLRGEGSSLPMATRVFVPWANMMFAILEE